MWHNEFCTEVFNIWDSIRNMRAIHVFAPLCLPKVNAILLPLYCTMQSAATSSFTDRKHKYKSKTNKKRERMMQAKAE